MFSAIVGGSFILATIGVGAFVHAARKLGDELADAAAQGFVEAVAEVNGIRRPSGVRRETRPARERADLLEAA